MLLGAAMAGVAIENSMLGATHSAANPLTARHGIVHGHAVGLMLPAVLAWNAQDEDAHREYQHLARMIGLSSVSELALHLRSLLVAAGLPASLSACSIDASQIPTLAEEAARQWTAQFNPRLTTANDFAELYRAAF